MPYSPQWRIIESESTSGAKDLASVVSAIASAHNVTPGQIALAWVQQQAGVWGTPVVPIPGTTRIEHLEQNILAASIALSPEELSRLDAA